MPSFIDKRDAVEEDDLRLVAFLKSEWSDTFDILLSILSYIIHILKYYMQKSNLITQKDEKYNLMLRKYTYIGYIFDKS